MGPAPLTLWDCRLWDRRTATPAWMTVFAWERGQRRLLGALSIHDKHLENLGRDRFDIPVERSRDRLT